MSTIEELTIMEKGVSQIDEARATMIRKTKEKKEQKSEELKNEKEKIKQIILRELSKDKTVEEIAKTIQRGKVIVRKLIEELTKENRIPDKQKENQKEDKKNNRNKIMQQIQMLEEKEVRKSIVDIMNNKEEIPEELFESYILYYKEKLKNRNIDIKDVIFLKTVMEFNPRFMKENNINIVIQGYIEVENPYGGLRFIGICKKLLEENVDLLKKLNKAEVTLQEYEKCSKFNRKKDDGISL